VDAYNRQPGNLEIERESEDHERSRPCLLGPPIASGGGATDSTGCRSAWQEREAEKEKAPRLLKRAGVGLWFGPRSGGAGLF